MPCNVVPFTVLAATFQLQQSISQQFIFNKM